VAEGLDDLKPGDDFNARHDWDDVLVPHAWSIFKTEGEVTYWARPGVTDHHGATTNHGGSDLLYVFTTGTGFKAQKSYDKFGAYATLEHGEDFAAAAKHLVTLGYGSGGQKAKEKAALAAGPVIPTAHGADAPVAAETDEVKFMDERRAHRKFPSWFRRTQAVVPVEGVVAPSPTQTDHGKSPTPEATGPAHGKGAKGPVNVQPAPPSDEELGVVSLKDFKATRVKWLWPHRIARGKFNLLASVGGEGKSQLATRLIAMITRGEEFPDGSGTPPHGPCVFLSAEDGLGDTIVPRLYAAGADLEYVKLLTARKTVVSKGKPHVSLMSFQDLDYFGEIFVRTRPVLMVVDPIPAYLGRGVDDHRNSEVRAVLEPFCALLDEFNVALLAITHVGKSVDQRTPIDKILGSVAYSNLARTVNVIYRDPQDPDRRLVCLLKNNLSPPQEALAYRIEEHEVEGEDGSPVATSRLVFEAGTVDVDAFELLAAQGKPRGPQAKRYAEMATWLFDRLKPVAGSVAVGNIVEEAGEEGFLGTLEKAGKRWTNFKLLYRGAGYVPKLAAPRDGHQVIQYVYNHQGKTFRRLGLIPAGSVPPPVPATTEGQVTVEVIGAGGASLPYTPPG